MILIAKELADVVIESGARSLAVVGTAKNVGKTVTMNYLVSELSSRGLTVGLVSSGRDGETVDSFTGEPKPSVIPPPGTWIATAEGVLRESGTCLEITDVLERTGIFGRLVLGRVVDSIPIELVGPRSARELSSLVKKLLAFGADIVLVDGALDRRAAASPQVTDAAILATGAAAQGNLNSLAEEIGFLVWLLSRQEPENRLLRDLTRKAMDKGVVCFVDSACHNTVHYSGSSNHPASSNRLVLRPTRYHTALGNEDAILEEAEQAIAVTIPGAVNQVFLRKVRSWVEDAEFSVVARDAVSIFADRDPGINLYVTEGMNLLAVTANPMSYMGISHDPAHMVSSISAALSSLGYPLPVFDVVSGEKSVKGVAEMAMG